MALDKKISDLAAATAFADPDLITLVKSSVNYKMTWAYVKANISTWIYAANNAWTGTNSFDAGIQFLDGAFTSSLDTDTLTANRVITFPNVTGTVYTTGQVVAVANGGTNSSSALNNGRIMVSAGGAIVEHAALTDGQLLIGKTGNPPTAATLTGTANQITVTDGAGSITLSTPQSINTTSSPTFVNVSGTAAPTIGNHLCNKTYVDALVDGRQWGAACRVCSTTAGTLASDFDNGKTVDSVTIATGNRIVLTAQADAKENGVYKVNASGAPTRDETETTLANHAYWVTEGTANGNKGWMCTNDTITYGVTSIAFVLVGSGVYTASTNMVLTGNAFSTSLTPSFTSATLSATSNQLALGTTHLHTINSVASLNARTTSMNDRGGDDNIVVNVTGTYGAGDPTKSVRFLSSGATAGKLMTLITSHTADRNLTIPDVTDTFAVIGTAQSFTALQTFSNGVKYATSGGTAATLNSYETDYKHTSSFYGIWASTQACDIYCTKLGKFVTIVIPTVLSTANTASVIHLTDALPSRFRTSYAHVKPFYVMDNGVYTMGTIELLTTGGINIYVAYSSNFTGSGNSGTVCSYISYLATT